MLQLILISLLLIAVDVGLAILFRKTIKTEKGIYILLLVAAFSTVVVHYSPIVYHLIKDGECVSYLTSNPNLVLPIYPCNVVMIATVIVGCLPNKNNRFSRYLIDFVVLFGGVSALVGMFANVDFIRNPTLADFDITKGIIAHGTMLLNSILYVAFGYLKIDLPRNMARFLIAVVMMAIIGLYDSAVILAFSGKEFMMEVNPMFMLHSPFEGVPFLMFPVIAGIGIVILFGVLVIIEAIKYRKDKEHIWYRRLLRKQNQQ